MCGFETRLGERISEERPRRVLSQEIRGERADLQTRTQTGTHQCPAAGRTQASVGGEENSQRLPESDVHETAPEPQNGRIPERSSFRAKTANDVDQPVNDDRIPSGSPDARCLLGHVRNRRRQYGWRLKLALRLTVIGARTHVGGYFTQRGNETRVEITPVEIIAEIGGKKNWQLS